MSENNSILKLQQAEDQAAQIIRNAREVRNNRLKQAKLDAASDIAAYREKKERKYQNSEALVSGPDAQLSKQIEADTASEIAKMQSDYEKNKEKVIQLLLAAATTVTIDAADNLKAL